MNWYGSLEGNGTLGDLMSLEAVATYLVARGHDVLHTTDAEIDISGTRRVELDIVSELDCDAAIFVCGPIIKSHVKSRQIFNQFSRIPFAGIGVSLFDTEHPNFCDPFDFVIARQRGNTVASPDVAILAPERVERTPGSGRIGICLRGAQSEYGTDLCRWREVEKTVTESARLAVRGDESRLVYIDTHLFNSGMQPDEIEHVFASCDVILTTRFHGAMIALRHRRPFIAIDQIQGGAKVWTLLSRLDWPDVYRVDDLPNVDKFAERVSRLMETTQTLRLEKIFAKECIEAHACLTQLEDWLISVRPRRPGLLARIGKFCKHRRLLW